MIVGIRRVWNAILQAGETEVGSCTRIMLESGLDEKRAFIAICKALTMKENRGSQVSPRHSDNLAAPGWYSARDVKAVK
jgi:hypothetical protein